VRLLLEERSLSKAMQN